GEWVPGRWWRVTYSDGRRYTDGPNAGELQVWCETSDEAEALDALASCPGGGSLMRQYERREVTWQAVG
ncbi:MULTISPECIES: hypothetical protein, partial [unclassified Mycobacterium]|uniref:hypothetical protein n=1 Tax=unclassified Mycobacterium TaxID=2642494 RepID=UPI0029C6483E